MYQIKSAKELNVLAKDSLDNAIRESKKQIGKGIYRSRGKWVVVTRKDGGDPIIGNGELEWKGTQKQLNSLINEYGNNPLVENIYIDGGVDYGESVVAFSDGWYEPWVGEWGVGILSGDVRE